MPNDMSAQPKIPHGVIRHPVYGPALPEQNWVPAPRYLLRRDRIMRHFRGVSPQRVLDIGCGSATILAELAARGFDCVGVDRSEHALALAHRVAEASETPIVLRAELDPAWKGTFDTMVSFEVLEHLDDDTGALAEWTEYLKPGGRLMVSVPAHPARWNPADEWAGHVRRYTRNELVRKVREAGFSVETFECYGFPLANMMEIACAPLYRRALKSDMKTAKSADALTDESGSDRRTMTRLWPVFASWPATLAMRAACLAQRPFLGTELGTSYIVVAQRA